MLHKILFRKFSDRNGLSEIVSLYIINTYIRKELILFLRFHDFYDIITTILNLDNDLTEKIMNGKLENSVMSISDREVTVSVFRLFSRDRKSVV